MGKNVQNLSKKKSFLHYLWELSGFFKGMMLLIGAVIVGVPDYLLSVEEAAALIKRFSTISHENEKVLLCLLMILNILILMVVALFVAYIIPEIGSAFCRMAAIRRYCYIPLTEDEVRKKGFESANEYFMFVNNLLSYWNPDYYNSKNYIILDNEDLYEMLNVCYKVFHDNGSIFTITKETVNCCDCDFKSFFGYYYDRKQEGKTSKETAYYDKDRNIILSYMCKKEIAKLKIRKPVTQKSKRRKQR
jgi:hypothetical protein